jgi:hypothetical protein
MGRSEDPIGLLIDRVEAAEQGEARIEELETVYGRAVLPIISPGGLPRSNHHKLGNNPKSLRGNNWATMVQKLATEEWNTGVEKYLKAASKDRGSSFGPLRPGPPYTLRGAPPNTTIPDLTLSFTWAIQTGCRSRS